jgi:hypothetical protein
MRTYASDELVAPLRALIQQHPTYGYRRLRVLLARGVGHPVSRKAVYGVLRRHRLMCHQRPKGARPRAQAMRSQASASNRRWSIVCDRRRAYCAPARGRSASDGGPCKLSRAWLGGLDLRSSCRKPGARQQLAQE